jgi:cytochrome c-type biogenesis protein CcmH
MNKFFVGIILLLWCAPALALTLEEPLPNPAQEDVARNIFHELRCVVCQSESLADSPAEVAIDMRREIRAQVAAGKPHDEIVSYFVARYGNFVLMQPPLGKTTTLLWLAPLATILAGGTLSFLYFKRQRRET